MGIAIRIGGLAVGSSGSSWTPPIPILTATALSGTVVNLAVTYNSIIGDGFKWERSDDNGANYSVIGTTNLATKTFLDTIGLSAGTLYYYRVRAYKGSNYSVYSEVVYDTTFATLYYVKNAGSDAANGLTAGTAWKTISKVRNATFTAGDRILFNRSDIWREYLSVHDAGNSTGYITYGAYGTGARPIIKNSLDCSGLSWSVYSGSVYVAAKTSMPTTCNAAWINNSTILIKATSVANVNAAGRFYNDNVNNLLYIWMSDSSDPTGKTIELALSTVPIATCAKNYITIRDIAFAHCGGNFAVQMNNDANSVDNNLINCEIGPNWKDGLLISCADGVVEHNYIHDCWSGIEYPSVALGYGIDVAGFSNGTIIRYNRVEGCTMGIRPYGTHKNLLIHNNLVIKNHVNGISVEGGAAGFRAMVYNNFVWVKPTGTAGHGIDLQLATDTNVGIKIKNNLIYSDYAGAATNVQLISISTADNSDIDINNNYYFISAGYTQSIGAFALTNYATLALWKAALAATSISGKDSNSMVGDPLLVDLNNGDYHLQAGSPCINAGVDVGLTEDYEGNPIVGMPDIGAYEKQ